MRERSRALWTRLGQLDPRYLVSFLITLVLVLGEARYGILGGYDRLAVALGVCVATELALSRWLRGRFANPQSAYITGISLALLIKPRVDLLWPFALGGFLAIASKYVLQYRGRHLWNPSNFAIALLVLAAPASVAILSRQWGNEHEQGDERGDLVFRAPHRVSSPHAPRHAHLCGGLRRARGAAPLDRRRPAARRNRADHRPDVPAVHFLHDHRPQDDREHGPGPDHRGRRRGRGGGGHPPGGGFSRGHAEPALSGAADPRPRDRRSGREPDRPGPHPQAH